jgi:hypothetical protein
MLIRAYGLHWNPDLVNWGRPGAGNKGKLLGKVKLSGRTHEIDFWEVYGIYVLHNDFRPIYVGKSAETRLGYRMRNHLTDRLAGRWDMFSWYSLSKVNTTSKSVSSPGARQIKPSTINDTLEAVGILIADPPLNRKRETIPHALSAVQVKNPHPKTVRHYLESILHRLDKRDDS